MANTEPPEGMKDYESFEETLKSTSPDTMIQSLSAQLLENWEVIENFDHFLRNEKINKNGEWERIKGTKPLLNELGISRLKLILYGAMSKISSIGNIDKYEEATIKRSFGKSIIWQLTYFYKEFELQDEGYAFPIFWEFMSIIELALSLAKHGGLLEAITTTTEKHTVEQLKSDEKTPLNIFSRQEKEG